MLVIDMQTGWLRRDVHAKEALIENVNGLVHRFAGRPIFFIRHTNGSSCLKNTENWQIDSRIYVPDDAIVLDKTHSSVFQEACFCRRLEEVGAARLVICGLVTNGCVQAACCDGVARGYSVVLAEGAHSTWHKKAERVLADWSVRLREAGVDCQPCAYLDVENPESTRMS